MIVNIWHGAMGPTGFRIKAKVDGDSARVIVATTTRLTPAVYTSEPIDVDDTGMIDCTVTGLTPDTGYFYGLEVDGDIDPLVSRTRTFPPVGEPAEFTTVVSSCSGHYNGGVSGGTTFWPPDSGVTDVSNAVVFGHIPAWSPLLVMHLGDLHYRDIDVNDPVPFRQAYDDVLSAPLQGSLYRNFPLAYVWDDHDYGANDSNEDSPSRPAACSTYRERVPSYPLNDTTGIWQTWVIGRVRFVMTDMRSYASPYTDPDGPDKTLTGDTQEDWFFETLEEATEELIVWACSVPYNTTGEVTNGSAYATWRNRWTAWFNDHPEIAARMMQVSGDWHGTGFDDGTHNKWGGFPILQCGPLDSAPSALGSKKFTHGHSEQRHQYVALRIKDTGPTITVTAIACKDDEVMFTYGFVRQVEAPALREVVGTVSDDDLPVYFRPQYHGHPLTPVAEYVATARPTPLD